jgi:hypothetical protein
MTTTLDAYPAWWDRLRLSNQQVADLLTTLKTDRAVIDEAFRALKHLQVVARANQFIADMPWVNLSAEDLATLVKGEAARRDARDGALGVIAPEVDEAVREKVFMGYLVLAAVHTADAGERIPRLLELVAPAMYFKRAGLRADAEIHRRSGPSVLAFTARHHLGYGADETLVTSELNKLVRRAMWRLRDTEGPGPRPAADLYGLTYETLVKKVPLAHGPGEFLREMVRATDGAFNNVPRAIQDDAVEEEVKGRPGPVYQCRACGHEWGGRGQGSRCPRCGGGPETIETTARRVLPLEEEKDQEDQDD